jgi:mRNA-degrading endonuclease RelE of RelBE toxin-antitoxin system
LAYRIEIRPKVEKELKKLPKHIVPAVTRTIDALAGDYRILYVVEDERLIVVVVKVAHRSDVYRRR